jgi:hypothetical protein
MKTHFDRDSYVKNLPDRYRKTKDSNNARILDLAKSSLDELRKAVSDVYDSLDIDKATGKSLDMFGDMVGQERGLATDEQYRAMIRSKICRNLTGADVASIINAICVVFGCSPRDIGLDEKNYTAVTLGRLPYEALNKSNIDAATAIKIIAGLMPVGVTLESVSFTGTFAFAATASEQDASAGFGNIEQTTGGYFGLLSDGEGSNLPV